MLSSGHFVGRLTVGASAPPALPSLTVTRLARPCGLNWLLPPFWGARTMRKRIPGYLLQKPSERARRGVAIFYSLGFPRTVQDFGPRARGRGVRCRCSATEVTQQKPCNGPHCRIHGGLPGGDFLATSKKFVTTHVARTCCTNMSADVRAGVPPSRVARSSGRVG